MAHGLPDYYRGVDIAYQALSEMITRPMYGSVRYGRGSIIAAANAPRILFSKHGKGILYGGYVYLDHTSTQEDSSAEIAIDYVSLENSSFKDLCKYSLVKPRSELCYLLKYDNTAFVYAVGLPPGITFETSISLTYTEGHGETPDINFLVAYALVI